jgi:hypothetical protein
MAVFRIEDFLLTFKKALSVLKLDPALTDELKALFETIQIRFTLFVKFEEIWNEKIKMQDRFPLSKDTAKKLKNMAWLIFVIAKSIS